MTTTAQHRPTSALLITDVCLSDGTRADVSIAEGRIVQISAAIGPGLPRKLVVANGRIVARQGANPESLN